MTINSSDSDLIQEYMLYILPLTDPCFTCCCNIFVRTHVINKIARYYCIYLCLQRKTCMTLSHLFPSCGLHLFSIQRLSPDSCHTYSPVFSVCGSMKHFAGPITRINSRWENEIPSYIHSTSLLSAWIKVGDHLIQYPGTFCASTDLLYKFL